MDKIDKRVGKEPANKIQWMREEVKLLRDNFEYMSIQQLANLVKKPFGTVRHKLNRMGLKRNHKHYAWTERQTNYLVRNYKKCGNVEIAETLNKRWPRRRKWTKKHVEKKMTNMSLKRTAEEIDFVLRKNKTEKRYDITGAMAKNKEIREQLTDNYIVANCLRISKPNRERIIKEHYSLIEYTRNRVLAQREKKGGQNGL